MHTFFVCVVYCTSYFAANAMEAVGVGLGAALSRDLAELVGAGMSTWHGLHERELEPQAGVREELAVLERHTSEVVSGREQVGSTFRPAALVDVTALVLG